MSGATEIELSFQLDEHGRTVLGCPGRDQSMVPTPIDYQTKTCGTSLSSETLACLDDLLLDAEIADSAIMPATFFLKCTEVPRFSFEQLALDIFHHHVPADQIFDPQNSGVEFWVQIRPSPEKTGRYAIFDPAVDGADMAKDGISFHWDKDEELRLLTNGQIYVHPHISTVTYLTGSGSPTMVASCLVDNVSGRWKDTKGPVHGYVSWPAQGKHLSFDGRYLHAAPGDLLEKREAIMNSDESMPEATCKVLRRRQRRVTFLVNIWLNYIPHGVERFPESMLDKMSGHETKVRLKFLETQVPFVCPPIDGRNDINTLVPFKWPLGNQSSTEILEAKMPLADIRREGLRQGNVKLSWMCPDVGGVRRKPAQTMGLYESDAYRNTIDKRSVVEETGTRRYHAKKRKSSTEKLI